MPLDKLPLVIIPQILLHLDNSIEFYFKLAKVDRAWRSLFTSDYLWAKFDVRSVVNGIATHYLNYRGVLYAQLSYLLNGWGSTSQVDSLMQSVDERVWELWLHPSLTSCHSALRYQGPFIFRDNYLIEYIPEELAINA